MQKHKKKRMSRKEKRAKQKKIRIGIGVGIAVVTIACGCFAYLYHYVNQQDADRAYKNLFIGELAVSGMTEEEIEEALAKQVELYGANTAKLSVEENSVEVSLKELGLSMENVEQLAKDAVAYGKTGSLLSRYGKVRDLQKEAVVIEEQYAVDKELATAVMEEQTAELENGAKDATITRSGSEFVITEGTPGRMVDIEKSIEMLLDALNHDWDYKNISVELAQTIAEPNVKKEDLESIQDLLGSFWTQAGGGSRLKNLERASELLNGTVVMPGEEVSVIAKTRPYTLENGYVEGSAYADGKIVTNIGGGLCQVSTTLYNAILYAELEITERSAHSMEVHYVDLSRDAAIAEGVKDLKFKNNYETPIYIEGYIDGNNRLTFNIYGKETRPENRKVEYESEVLETTEYTTKYVADSGSSIGYIGDEEGTGMDGGKARLWKVVYVDGKEVSREKKNSSTYRATTVTVKVGVKSEYSEATKIMTAAVKSQNKDKINAAIKEAKKLIEEKEKEKEDAAEKDKDSNTASDE